MLLASCQKESIDVLDTKLSIVQARQLVNEQLIELYPSGDVLVRDGNEVGFEIDWDNASFYHSSNKNMDVVEANIIQAPISVPVFNNGTAYDSLLYLEQIPQRRVVVTLDANNNSTIFILKIVPKPSLSMVNNVVTGTNFDHYSLNFSGLLQFASLNDTVYGTWLVQNGSEYLMSGALSNFRQDKQSLETRDVVCDWVDVYYYDCCCAFSLISGCGWVHTTQYGCFTGGGASGYTDYFPDTGTGTSSGGGSSPGQGQTNYAQYIIDQLDDPALLRQANLMFISLSAQYGLTMPLFDILNIMELAALDLIYANLDWQINDSVNDIYIFENAFQELLFLKEIGYPLNPVNNAQTEAFLWLQSNNTQANTLRNHYYTNIQGEKIIETHINALAYLSKYNDIPLIDFLDAYDEWFNTPNPTEISNNIDILSSSIPQNDPPSSSFLMETQYRHPWTDPYNPPEDMQHGYTGNDVGIKGCKSSSCTDNAMFVSMTDLFEWTSTEPLQTQAYAYIDRFENKEGGVYFNQIVCNAIKESTTFKNFVKTAGLILNEKLKESNGSFSSIQFNDEDKIDLSNARPRFNGIYNKLTGLQILINDTEQTQISHLNDFTSNPVSGTWEVTLLINIIDHFGLDRHDVILYQGWHNGFPNWWRLQHTRGYPPFLTNYKISVQIKGDYKP